MILIVEDEAALANVLGEYLSHSGYESHIIEDGGRVIDWIKQHSPELVILDLMLPNRDGLDIYRELRTFSEVPVIMATAKVDEIDRLLGLELGADDYVCKPYSPRELVVRVKNILRRVQAKQLQSTQHQALTSVLRIDEAQMKAWVHDKVLSLTPAEFHLLAFFFQHTGQVFSRNQLMDKIYDDDRVVTDRTIDSHIKNLRKKILAIDSESDWIKSVYGVGYRFEIDEIS
ncbi:two-component system response regulator BaeR [Photobacterium rosenbergii]|uniref:Two-component system response regulator BaeR n=1 Tax=Photobacterium rosenbergii TaxID=294936 RepID=A0A2T3N7W3_9GAMM|nr:response regulator [Photobacterium rosenbergii]PSW09187.1 two-component system response regulator BaeR [Photobacterium rosenbergii]